MTLPDLLHLQSQLAEAERDTLARKSHDYAGFSGDALANFRMSETVGVEPMRAILVRVMDKIGRIRTFLDKGELRVENEPVVDAMRDIRTYMLLLEALTSDQSAPERLEVIRLSRAA